MNGLNRTHTHIYSIYVIYNNYQKEVMNSKDFLETWEELSGKEGINLM